MKLTANEYAKLGIEARQLATKVKPDENHPYAHALGKAAVYLHLAGTELKSVAEALGEEESIKCPASA